MEFPTWEELQEDAPAQAVVGMAFVCVGLVLFMARGQLRAWLDEQERKARVELGKRA